MNSTDIQKLVNDAKGRISSGKAGFIVLGYDVQTEHASNHAVLGTFEYYEDALEAAGCPTSDGAHIIHDEDLVHGFTAILLREIDSFRARRSAAAGTQPEY